MIIQPTTKNNNIPHETTDEETIFGYNLQASMRSLTKKFEKQWSKLLEHITNHLVGPLGGEEEEKHTIHKTKRKESQQKLRHWKIVKTTTWQLTPTVIQLILILTTIQHSIYNLYHDKIQVDKMGNPFPIKLATMITKRSKLKRMYIKQHRKNKRMREWKETM